VGGNHRGSARCLACMVEPGMIRGIETGFAPLQVGVCCPVHTSSVLQSLGWDTWYTTGCDGRHVGCPVNFPPVSCLGLVCALQPSDYDDDDDDDRFRLPLSFSISLSTSLSTPLSLSSGLCWRCACDTILVVPCRPGNRREGEGRRGREAGVSDLREPDVGFHRAREKSVGVGSDPVRPGGWALGASATLLTTIPAFSSCSPPLCCIVVL